MAPGRSGRPLNFTVSEVGASSGHQRSDRQVILIGPSSRQGRPAESRHCCLRAQILLAVPDERSSADQYHWSEIGAYISVRNFSTGVLPGSSTNQENIGPFGA